MAHPIQHRLFVCGSDELAGFQSQKISHFVGVANPGGAASTPDWFKGAHLQLWFGDVVSESDAKRCKTTPPRLEDVKHAVEFFRGAWAERDSKILVSCDYGASRSPALAYLFIADQLGAGRETEALNIVLEIRSCAVPNGLVVRLGDAFLERSGALVQPLKKLYAKIHADLFPG